MPSGNVAPLGEDVPLQNTESKAKQKDSRNTEGKYASLLRLGDLVNNAPDASKRKLVQCFLVELLRKAQAFGLVRNDGHAGT